MLQCRLRRGWLALASVFGVLGALGPGAQAQTEPAPAATSPDSSEGSEYSALVGAAVDEFERHNWTEAYALFVQAHALEPSARTLRGLAVCSFEAKQYLRAIEYMRAALADSRKPLSDEQRTEAASVIARAQVFVARLHVSVTPNGSSVEVDTHPALRDEQDRVLLDPGPHQLTVSHAGYTTETRTVQASPGDQLSLVIQLVASVPDASAAPTLPPTSQRTRTEVAQSAARTWAWVSASGSLVLAGAGVTMFVLGRNGMRDVEKACPKDACSAKRIEQLIDDKGLEALKVGSIVAFVLAGASAVASAVLFAQPVEAPAGAVSYVPKLGGAGLRADF